MRRCGGGERKGPGNLGGYVMTRFSGNHLDHIRNDEIAIR